MDYDSCGSQEYGAVKRRSRAGTSNSFSPGGHISLAYSYNYTPGEERVLPSQPKMTVKDEGSCRFWFHHQTLEIDLSIGSENVRPSGLSPATGLQLGNVLESITFWRELHLESELCVSVCWPECTLLVSCHWASSRQLGAVDQHLCRRTVIVHPPNLSECLVWASGRSCLSLGILRFPKISEIRKEVTVMNRLPQACIF